MGAEQAENVTIRLPDVPGLMYTEHSVTLNQNCFRCTKMTQIRSNARAYPCRFLSTLCGGTAILAKESISIERLASCTGLTSNKLECG